jgi:hypothetical protein
MQARKSATSDVIMPLQVDHVGFLMRKSFCPFVGPIQLKNGECSQPDTVVVKRDIKWKSAVREGQKYPSGMLFQRMLQLRQKYGRGIEFRRRSKLQPKRQTAEVEGAKPNERKLFEECDMKLIQK